MVAIRSPWYYVRPILSVPRDCAPRRRDPSISELSELISSSENIHTIGTLMVAFSFLGPQRRERTHAQRQEISFHRRKVAEDFIFVQATIGRKVAADFRFFFFLSRVERASATGLAGSRVPHVTDGAASGAFGRGTRSDRCESAAHTKGTETRTGLEGGDADAVNAEVANTATRGNGPRCSGNGGAAAAQTRRPRASPAAMRVTCRAASGERRSVK